MKNLFDNPTTLRDPKDMVGRRVELERIFELIRTKQNSALVGSRRTGKTSLLTCLKNADLQREFHCDPSLFLFLYLDLQRYSTKKEQMTFLGSLCRAIKEQSKHLNIQINETLADDDLFERLLDEILQRGLYPVLMMDAFDEITKYSSIEEFSFLRAMGGEAKISYITASMSLPSEIIRKLPNQSGVSSPFDNIFSVIQLMPISVQEVSDWLLKTSRAGGLPFTQDEVSWIIRLAGGHPYLLQRVAVQLFEARRLSRGNKIHYDRIQKEVQRAFSSHFDDFWTLLSAEDRSHLIEDITPVLSAASASHHTDGKAQYQYGSLIYPEFQGSNLFYNYLQVSGKVILSKPSKIDSPLSKIDFKMILNQLNNTNELGQSELIYVPFIARRIEQQQAADPTERGAIVRQVLQEALERMKGQGEHSHENRSWLHYDILQNRYIVRNSPSQTTIAGLLGYSERQYYRYVDQALKRLKNELEAMNATEALEQRF